jgi:peptidoglycan/LPS O-acetylase OafA/YrhL
LTESRTPWRPNRDVRADIRWGVRESLVLTGIIFVPALLVAVFRGAEAIRSVVLIFLGYLLFSALAGVLLGLTRPMLGRTVGAAGVGAIVGAVGFVALICLPRSGRPFPGAKAAVASAALGALVGAACGAMARRQVMSRDRAA